MFAPKEGRIVASYNCILQAKRPCDAGHTRAHATSKFDSALDMRYRSDAVGRQARHVTGVDPRKVPSGSAPRSGSRRSSGHDRSATDRDSSVASWPRPPPLLLRTPADGSRGPGTGGRRAIFFPHLPGKHDWPRPRAPPRLVRRRLSRCCGDVTDNDLGAPRAVRHVLRVTGAGEQYNRATLTIDAIAIGTKPGRIVGDDCRHPYVVVVVDEVLSDLVGIDPPDSADPARTDPSPAPA